jgi:hypothetical protein
MEDLEEEEADNKWAQLRKMERFLEQQRLELLQQGVPDLDDEVWDGPQWPYETEDCLDKEEDDSLENEDLTYITSVLNSFSNTKSGASKLNGACYEILTLEGATALAEAKHTTPQRFNQKFNQNLMMKSSATNQFNCFPTIEEEGASEFSDKEDILSESNPDEFEFETPSEVDAEDETPFTGIYSISEERGPAFSAWRPYIPPEPVFRNSSAHSWWSASLLPEYSSLEPTPTKISAITGSILTIGQTPVPVSMTHTRIRRKQTPQHDWKPYKPATKRYKHNWNKPWPKSNRMSKGTRNSLNESHDHPEQSKPFKLWKPRLPYSAKPNTNQNTKFRNMPLEIDTGNAHQRFTQCTSRICFSMTSRINTTRTRSWVTKWRKCSTKYTTGTRNFQGL